MVLKCFWLMGAGEEISPYCERINWTRCWCDRPDLHIRSFSSSRWITLWYPHFSLAQDSVWGGTGSSSLYQSNHTSGQQQRFETVTSGKKKKKQKMVRADPSLLGESKHPLMFSCSCSFRFHPNFISSFCVSQVFLWMRHLRDWIWERLRLWRTFKGLQPSKTPLTLSDLNSSSVTWTLVVAPWLLPQPSPMFSVSFLSDILW